MPVKIFFCYAHEDEALLIRLKAHLKPLERQGLIETWYDREIDAGAEWEQEISQRLNTAQIILLLISPDFMNSEYCSGTELKRALERQERGETQVIPVIVRAVYWQGILGQLQALPKDALPITDPDWYNQDRAFYSVTEGIRKIVDLQFQPQEKPKAEAQKPVFPKQERKHRQVLLQKVKARLAEEIRASLYHKILEEFKLSQVPVEVVHPWHFLYQPLPHAAYELPANTSITEVYDRTQGTLLLTGEGGAGKTTLLQMLALDLLQRAEQEETEPIPFVVNLATWTKKHQDFSQWLVETLAKKPYRLSPLVSQRLIQKDLVLPLLDGVNQIAPSELAACVQAIDIYQKEHSLLPLVLCSRDTDVLEHLGGHLLDGIVTIQPLLPQQIDTYLQSIGGARADIFDTFRRDPLLYELAKTPLILCLLMLLTRHGAGFDPATPVTIRRQRIFSLYAEYMLNRSDIPQLYPSQKIKRWLRFLARYLINNRENEFYIENLTVESVHSQYTGFSATILQVLLGIMVGITTIIPVGWGLARLVDSTLRAYAQGYAGITTYFDIFQYLPSIPLSSLLFLTLLFSDIVWLFFFCYPLYAFWPRPHRPTGILHFWEVWTQLAKEYKLFLIFGALGLVPILWAISGPFPAIASALISFATVILRYPIPRKLTPDLFPRPNQGVRYSFFQSITYGLACGLFYGSVTGLAVWSETTLSWGLTIGFFTAWVIFWLVGYSYGGKLVFLHYVLRIIALSQVLPLNLSRFLHHAESRLLLRRIGGGYSFYHPFFLEYFAASSTTMQVSSAGAPSSKRAKARGSVPASRRRRKRATRI